MNEIAVISRWAGVQAGAATSSFTWVAVGEEGADVYYHNKAFMCTSLNDGATSSVVARSRNLAVL